MIRYGPRHWILAGLLATLAGFIDAIGFIKLGGLFVSFMSGNSTRLAVGAATGSGTALTAAELILSFVLGVMAGSWTGFAAKAQRKAAVLLLVSLLLGCAALLDMHAMDRFVPFLLAFAMGAANAVFERDGEVSIGVTYMTGTLVKFGQRLAAALRGGPRWEWAPYLILWVGLVAGAVAGAFLYPKMGVTCLWFATLLAAGFAMLATKLGPASSPASDASGPA